MKQPIYALPVGTRITTHAVLGPTETWCVKPRHIDARRPAAEGEIVGVVPGLGGDCYWVQHGPGEVAAYCFTEFELIEEDTR